MVFYGCLRESFVQNAIKNFIDHYYKTIYGPVRNECSSCRMWKILIAIYSHGFNLLHRYAARSSFTVSVNTSTVHCKRCSTKSKYFYKWTPKGLYYSQVNTWNFTEILCFVEIRATFILHDLTVLFYIHSLPYDWNMWPLSLVTWMVATIEQ